MEENKALEDVIKSDKQNNENVFQELIQIE